MYWSNAILSSLYTIPVLLDLLLIGPFVMNSQQEIFQTFQDYSQGKNGFERAPNWQSEIGKESHWYGLIHAINNWY